MWKLAAMYAALVLPAAVYMALHGRAHAHTHAHKGGHRHGERLDIDYLAYSSRMRSWNPALKALLSLSTILLCLLLDNPHVSAAALFFMAFLAVAVGGIALREYIGTLTTPIVFILLSALAVAVEYSAKPAGEYRLFLGFGYLYTSGPMLARSALLTLKVMACVSALNMLILATPFSELIAVLKKARVPRLIIDLMHMIYRFIFILLEVSHRMRASAEARLGYRDTKTSWYTFGHIAGNLLVLSLRRAGAYYDAMEARCYDGELAFLEEDKPLRPGHVLPSLLFLLYLPLMWYLTK